MNYKNWLALKNNFLFKDKKFRISRYIIINKKKMRYIFWE